MKRKLLPPSGTTWRIFIRSATIPSRIPIVDGALSKSNWQAIAGRSTTSGRETDIVPHRTGLQQAMSQRLVQCLFRTESSSLPTRAERFSAEQNDHDAFKIHLFFDLLK